MRGTEPQSQDHAGVIAPPPLIFGGILLIALGIDMAVGGPGFALAFVVRMGVGSVLLLAGLALITVSAIQFRRARTNLEPWKPTTTIVTSGVYSFSRNPIYLGMAFSYSGLSLMADSVLALAGLPFAIAAIQYGVIEREEHYLEIKFGESYRQYKKQVRRWL